VDNQTNAKLDQSIKKVIECDIFDYLEMNDIPESDKERMMENIIISLRARVLIRIADIIEQKDKQKFEDFKKMLDKNPSDSEFHKTLDEFDINLDAITAEEALLLKSEVMGLKSAKAGGKDERK